MFKDVTCEECACIRLKKGFICCVSLRIGAIIMGCVEMAVGLGCIGWGAYKWKASGNDLERSYKVLVFLGADLVLLGAFCLFCCLKKVNRESWLCSAYVVHIIFGVILGCLAFIAIPFKMKNYYPCIYVAVAVLLIGYTALVLNSYRLDRINYKKIEYVTVVVDEKRRS